MTETSDDYDKAVSELIVMLRGPPPPKCDFCQREFTADRYPVPEEGQQWACSECEEMWRELEAKGVTIL